MRDKYVLFIFIALFTTSEGRLTAFYTKIMNTHLSRYQIHSALSLTHTPHKHINRVPGENHQ